ncbi:GNAT family N-acetyltransferase [Paenibacillus dokdonensis]|uniref:GNAT family N-acetyltransferase n=1 Tax=Paenibacillus dokdonensis TaxID=2567944 RepID=A0ABU6GNW3_9BACL|nr:GNAT family N-acetyltransferase [Paenibacillus dokdonensis]MEC0239951.1 GNAT family N-acetyltransferase [Paenibacillus dokdonensis]
MKIEKTYSPNEKDIEKVRKMLQRYNSQHFETIDEKEFAIYIKESEKIIAGVTGTIFGKWMEIKYLVVEEKYRGDGLGKKLLELAEKEAIKNDCEYIFLYTFGFQGVNFYPKFGFKEVFSIKNYPLTGTEHWFIKEL